MPPPPKDLDKLAQDLLSHGPVKTLLASPKRIRIHLGGRFVADTTAAVYVWEHPYYPIYYIPTTSFVDGALSPGLGPDRNRDNDNPAGSGEPAAYRRATLSAGDASTDRVVVFSPGIDGKGGALAGLTRVEPAGGSLAWFEEDEKVDGSHPKDPFKRVDVVFSARRVRVLVAGVEVARAASAFHLYETGLPARFYLAPSSVRADLLRESPTVTHCPYKGLANYYDVVVAGAPVAGGEGEGEGREEKRFKDIVWYYKTPKLECAAVAGCLCFYNEKVDIELDGVMLEKPKSPFS